VIIPKLFYLQFLRMSALNFMKTLSRKIAKDSAAALAPAEPTSTAISITGKKQFMHGNNVIIKRGTYKGYFGFVYDFQPAKFEVEVEEQAYVYDLPDEEITKYKIVKNVPMLYALKLVDGKEVRMPAESIMPVVVIKDNNGNLKLANIINQSVAQCELRIIKTSLTEQMSGMSLNDSPNKYARLFDQLSEQVKSGELEASEVKNCDSARIVTDVHYFILHKPQTQGDVDLQGQYGTLQRMIKEQYIISRKKNVLLAKGDVKSIDHKNNTLIIKGGFYKGSEGKLVYKHPAILTVYVDSISKKVNSHIVNENGKFVHKPLTPNDVFYMDILLKNGNYFEVKEVVGNKIIGVERASNGYIPKEIAESDVESYQPGFSFSTKPTGTSTMDTVSSAFVQDDNDSDVENDSDNESDFADPETDETDETNPFEVFTRDIVEPEEMKSSYKDSERTAMMTSQLTKKQLEIKNKIDNVTSMYGVGDEINIYNLIAKVESMIDEIKGHLKEKNIAFWSPMDEKYIIFGVVFHEIVKRGFGHVIAQPKQDIVQEFIEDLMNKKYINKKDTVESVFLRGDWSVLFSAEDDVIASLRKKKEFAQIARIIFTNCLRVITHYLGDINLKNRFILREEDLIPLGRKKEEVVKVIYPKDLVQNNIPSTAEKVMWGPKFSKLIDQYKNSLAQKANSSSNNTNKIVYEYVLENLQRAPFALAELAEDIRINKLKIDQAKALTLKLVYDQLLQKVQRLLELQEKEKTMNQNNNHKQNIERKRKEISERNTLFSDFDDLEISVSKKKKF
jgi:hypothetical protein